MSEKTRILLGFSIISLIWGSTWLAIKIGLDSVPPFYGVAIRFSLAAIVLLMLVRVRGEKFLFDRTSLLLYLNLGVLSFSLPYALVYWGEQYIASGLASILFAAYPFVVAIGSHFFLPEERLNFHKSIGILLGFVGVIVIFWSDIQLGTANSAGMGAILLSTVMQGTSLVVVKRKHKNLSATALTCGGMIIGVLIMYGLAFLFESFSSIRFDAKGIGSIVYLGTFGTVVTFVIYYWLVRKIEAVYLSLVSLVTPILAVILGALFLGEVLSSRVFIGATLVLFGILIANGKDAMSAVRSQKERFFSQ